MTTTQTGIPAGPGIETLTVTDTEPPIEVANSNSSIKGVVVEVPAGALSQDCTITIATFPDPPKFPDTIKGIGLVVEFGPDDMIFNQPISIKIPYTQNDLDTAGVNDPSELEAFIFNTSTESWNNIPIESVDTTNRLLICKVDHFSMYAIGKSVTPSDTHDPDSNDPASQSSSSSGGGCFVSTTAEALPLKFFNDNYRMLLCCSFIGRLSGGSPKSVIIRNVS